MSYPAWVEGFVNRINILRTNEWIYLKNIWNFYLKHGTLTGTITPSESENSGNKCMTSNSVEFLNSSLTSWCSLTFYLGQLNVLIYRLDVKKQFLKNKKKMKEREIKGLMITFIMLCVCCLWCSEENDGELAVIVVSFLSLSMYVSFLICGFLFLSFRISSPNCWCWKRNGCW